MKYPQIAHPRIDKGQSYLSKPYFYFQQNNIPNENEKCTLFFSEEKYLPILFENKWCSFKWSSNLE